MARKNTNLVYSTESGRVNESAKPGKKSKKKKNTATPPQFKQDGVIRVRREMKGRGGKTVTAIYNAPFEGAELKDFARGLKQLCGTGGTLKDGAIIIQGDHCDKIVAHLQKEGFPVKRAGG